MQKSAYNIIVPVSDSKNVLFNAMTKKFFYISKHNTAACLFMLNNIESFLSDEAKGFVEKLYDNGFVIDDDRDELSELKSLFYEYKTSVRDNKLCLKALSCIYVRDIGAWQPSIYHGWLLRQNPHVKYAMLEKTQLFRIFDNVSSKCLGLVVKETVCP